MEQYRRMMSKTFITFVLPEVGFAIHYLDMYAQYGLCEMDNHITLYYEEYIDKDAKDYNADLERDVKPYRIKADIKACLTTVHSLNYCLIDFLQSESISYQNYFRTEISPKFINEVENLLAHKDLELNIFREERDADILHDVYMALDAMYKILKSQESLILDNSELKNILSYNLSMLCHSPKTPMLDSERSQDVETPMHLHNAIEWNGSPAELACLFTTLADNGYINYPDRKDGGRNNAAFARLIYSHINIANGSFDTLVNNLKDSRITANNQFKIAMDRLPKLDNKNK